MAANPNPSHQSKRKFELNPAELRMVLVEGASPQATLTITNTSDTLLAFKVKTTLPKRYLVKPNQDVIPPRAQAQLNIQMQARECLELLREGFEGSWGKDKFLVQAVGVDDEFLEQFKAAKQTDTVGALFQTLFEKKDDVSNRRIACVFEYPMAVAVDGGSASAPPSQSQRPATSASASSASSAKPKSMEPEIPTPVTNSAAPASSSSSSAQQQQHQVAAFSNNGNSSSQSNDYENLAQLYAKAMNLIVILTDERDKFQAAYKEANRQLVQLGEEVKEQRPRGGGGKDGGGALQQVHTSKAAAGYQLWHLLVVALVTFLLSRLVQISQLEKSASPSSSS